MPEPSVFEAELATENLKSHKSPGNDEIPAEVIKSGHRTISMRCINILFLFGIRKNCLRSGRSRSLYLSIYTVRLLSFKTGIIKKYLP